MLPILNVSQDQYLADYNMYKMPVYEKNIFLWLISLVTLLSVLGNTASFLVNIKRKMRSFYRTCLLSLAFSDLLTTITSAIPIIAQLSTLSTELWVLGEILCDGIPFAYTASMLINSITLASITVVRYMAVKKVLMNILWDPGIWTCAAFIFLNYGVAIGLSSPIIASFHIEEYVLVITDPENPDTVIERKNVQICSAEPNDGTTNSNYTFYLIVYGIVIVPIILIFLLLNCIIIKEMCRKRKLLRKSQKLPRKHLSCTSSQKSKSLSPIEFKKFKTIEPIDEFICEENMKSVGRQESSKSLKVTRTKNVQTYNEVFLLYNTRYNELTKYYQGTKYLKSGSGRAGERKWKNGKRISHQSKFCLIVIILMIVFLICRFPRSLFIVLYLETGKVAYNEKILNYCLELLSLMSCVLNPLFYTFMPETIKFLSRIIDLFNRLGTPIKNSSRTLKCLRRLFNRCRKQRHCIVNGKLDKGSFGSSNDTDLYINSREY